MFLTFMRVCAPLLLALSVFDGATSCWAEDRGSAPPERANWGERRFWDPNAPDLTEEELHEIRVLVITGDPRFSYEPFNSERDRMILKDPSVRNDPRVQSHLMEARRVLLNQNPSRDEYIEVMRGINSDWSLDSSRLASHLAAFQELRALRMELLMKLEKSYEPPSQRQIALEARTRALNELVPGRSEADLLRLDERNPELGLRRQFQRLAYRYEIQISEEHRRARRPQAVEGRPLPPEIRRWLRERIPSEYSYSELEDEIIDLVRGKPFSASRLLQDYSPYHVTRSRGLLRHDDEGALSSRFREIKLPRLREETPPFFGVAFWGRRESVSEELRLQVSMLREDLRAEQRRRPDIRREPYASLPSALQAPRSRSRGSGALSGIDTLQSGSRRQIRSPRVLRAHPQGAETRITPRNIGMGAETSDSALGIRARSSFNRPSGRELFVIAETNTSTLVAAEPLSVWKRSLIPNMTVEQSDARLDSARRVAIPTQDRARLRTVQVRDQNGQLLQQGRDYSVLYDPRDGGYVLQVSEARRSGEPFRIESTFQAQPRQISRRQAQPIELDRVRVEALTHELEADGFTALSSRLHARLLEEPERPLTDDEVERIFRESATYTYDTQFGESREAGEGRFSRFRGYLDTEGRVCAQCDGANGLFRVFLEGALNGDAEIEVRNRTVLVMNADEREVAFPPERVHADTAISDRGGLRRRLDVTPRSENMTDVEHIAQVAQTPAHHETSESALDVVTEAHHETSESALDVVTEATEVRDSLHTTPSEVERARLSRNREMRDTLRESRRRLSRNLSGEALPSGASRPEVAEIRARVRGNSRTPDQMIRPFAEATEAYLMNEITEAQFREKLIAFLGLAPSNTDSTEVLITRARERATDMSERLRFDRAYRERFTSSFGSHDVYGFQVTDSTQKLFVNTAQALEIIDLDYSDGVRGVTRDVSSACLRGVVDAANSMVLSNPAL